MTRWFWRGILGLGAVGGAGFALINAERPMVAAAGAVLVAGMHAVLLGVECIAAGLRNSRDLRLPHAPLALRAAAWWDEVCVDARMFGWEQPFRSGRYPALRLQPRGRRGVVFVHGFLCNRGVWNPWLSCLPDNVAYATVETRSMFARIDGEIAAVEAAVAAMEQGTGRAPVIVAHSMGGLLVRAWLDARAASDRVHRVVTIATPHGGTAFAALPLGANVRQMRRDGPWLAALAQREPVSQRARITAFYGNCDNVVVPASSAMLAGAQNIHLAGVAHLAMLYRPEVFAEVMRWLDDEPVAQLPESNPGAPPCA